MNISKEEALKKIEELKKYVNEVDTKKEEKVVGIAIKTRLGNIIFQSTKSTYKEAIIEKGDADLRDANLFDADLSDADLRGANLSGADLSDADLRGANLFDANLSGADLRDANLFDADLRGAEMQNVKFYGRGGTKPLTKKQVPAFLLALGYKIEE